MEELHSTDSNTLALLGKKQVLKRRFAFLSLVSQAVLLRLLRLL